MKSSGKIVSKFFKSSSSNEEKSYGSDVGDSPEVSAVLNRIENLAHGSHRDNELAMEKSLILSHLYRILSASVPDPENNEPAVIPQWRKEQIMTEWLTQCEINGIDKPLSRLVPKNYSLTSHVPGKSLKCLEEVFGKALIVAAIENERSDYNTQKSDFNVHDATIEASAKKLQKLILKNELRKDPPGYFDATVIPAVREYLTAEEKADKESPAHRFILAIQRFLEKPAEAGGILARSLNGWETPEKLDLIAKYYEIDMEHITRINLHYLEDSGTPPMDLSMEENNYIAGQTARSLGDAWNPVMEQMFASLFDEVLNPETGKLREEIIDLIRQIQMRLPEGSPGRAFDLSDEKNLEATALGLMGSLFTNIYFGTLTNAPAHVIESLMESGDMDKMQFFAATTNNASSKVLNTYNGLISNEQLGLDDGAFKFRFGAWKVSHGLSSDELEIPGISGDMGSSRSVSSDSPKHGV